MGRGKRNRHTQGSLTHELYSLLDYHALLFQSFFAHMKHNLAIILIFCSGVIPLLAEEPPPSEEFTVEPVITDHLGWLSWPDFSITASANSAYDSNTFLTPTDEVDSWVHWLSIGVTTLLGNQDDQGFYAGASTGASFYLYEDARAEGGRDNAETAINVFGGIVGAKTTLRASTTFMVNNGNTTEFTEFDRERRRAESNDWGFVLSGSRDLPHGRLDGSFTYDQVDFDSDTLLNDRESISGDIAWFFQPSFTPKTDMGIGLRVGTYNSDRNFDQTFYEPSLRFVHQLSPKTDFNASFGYQTTSYEGAGAIEDTGNFSTTAGMNWRATESTSVGLSLYREFQPSFVTVQEDFFVTGTRLSISQRLPYGFSGSASLNYEDADYYSTLEGGSAGREDEYWRLGFNVSHGFNPVKFLDGQVSAFYHYNTNDSSLSFVEYEQHFTGIKFTFSY